MRLSIAELRARGRELTRGLVRRLRVAASDAVLWTLEGYVDALGNTESVQAEVFSGIGVHARPAAGDRAEVVVLQVGGQSGHPVIVATRNHAWVKAYIAAVGDNAGESALFNASAMVRIGADGVVRVGSLGGATQALATKADLDTVIAAVNGHTHTVPIEGPAGTTTTTTPLPTPSPWPLGAAAGTAKTEAE